MAFWGSYKLLKTEAVKSKNQEWNMINVILVCVYTDVYLVSWYYTRVHMSECYKYIHKLVECRGCKLPLVPAGHTVINTQIVLQGLVQDQLVERPTTQKRSKSLISLKEPWVCFGAVPWSLALFFTCLYHWYTWHDNLTHSLTCYTQRKKEEAFLVATPMYTQDPWHQLIVSEWL